MDYFYGSIRRLNEKCYALSIECWLIHQQPCKFYELQTKGEEEEGEEKK